MRIIEIARRTDCWDLYDPSQSVSKGLKKLWARWRSRTMFNVTADRLYSLLRQIFDPPLCVPA